MQRRNGVRQHSKRQVRWEQGRQMTRDGHASAQAPKINLPATGRLRDRCT